MQSITFTDIRAHLANAMREVENGEAPLLISRRGQPAGVLMSWPQYQELASPGGIGFADSLNRWRAECLADNGPADDPFANLRDAGPGRAVEWTE